MEKKKDNESTYLIEEKIYSLDTYIRQNVAPTIPKVHNDIRIHLLDQIFEMLANVKKAAFTKGNMRAKYITDALVNVSLADYLMKELNELHLVDHKRMNTTIYKLTDIKNILFVWMNKENEKKQCNV